MKIYRDTYLYLQKWLTSWSGGMVTDFIFCFIFSFSFQTPYTQQTTEEHTSACRSQGCDSALVRATRPTAGDPWAAFQRVVLGLSGPRCSTPVTPPRDTIKNKHEAQAESTLVTAVHMTVKSWKQPTGPKIEAFRSVYHSLSVPWSACSCCYVAQICPLLWKVFMICSEVEKVGCKAVYVV